MKRISEYIFKPFKTDDGSYTLYSTKLNESYHSRYGAVRESEHVFIDAGFHKTEPDGGSLSILELGMGTGLNVFLSYKAAMQKKYKVEYTAVEAYPIEQESIAIIKSGLKLIQDDLKEDVGLFMDDLHNMPWNHKEELRPGFEIEKRLELMETASYPGEHYHLVYFDAFAPDIQPELWEQDVFERLYESMQEGGFLLTYCAKGAVRRRLMACGFFVERIDGPPGKRHMLRAKK